MGRNGEFLRIYGKLSDTQIHAIIRNILKLYSQKYEQPSLSMKGEIFIINDHVQISQGYERNLFREPKRSLLTW